MSCYSFFCPIFLGHPEARASASKASGCFMGGNTMFWGGTGKAEDAKLQDAGISPKQCPGKGVAEKGWLAGLSKDRREEQDHVDNHGGKNGSKVTCHRKAPST